MSGPTTEHPSAVQMREVPEAVARGDISAALEKFPEDVVWYSPAVDPAERVYRGRDGLASFFGRLHERSNGTMTLEVEEVLGSDRPRRRLPSHHRGARRRRLDVLVAHFATVGPQGFAAQLVSP